MSYLTVVMLFVVKFTDFNVGGPVERGNTSLRSREPFKLLRSKFLHDIYIKRAAKASLDSEDLVHIRKFITKYQLSEHV